MKTNKTTRELAIEWWNKLDSSIKEMLASAYNKGFSYKLLSGYLIENIWKNELPLEVRESYYGAYKELNVTKCDNVNCQNGVINGVKPKVCKKCNPTKIQDKVDVVNIKTIFIINNRPVLDITILNVSKDNPNYGIKFGTNRDRNPNRGWTELRGTNMSNAKEVELTEELKQTLLEDLAYAYGNNTSKFTEKLKEFGFIK